MRTVTLIGIGERVDAVAVDHVFRRCKRRRAAPRWRRGTSASLLFENLLEYRDSGRAAVALHGLQQAPLRHPDRGEFRVDVAKRQRRQPDVLRDYARQVFDQPIVTGEPYA